MRSLIYLGLFAFASFFLTLSSLPLYAISIGTSRGTAGLVTTVMLAATVLTQTLVPALVNRFGLVQVLAAGLVLLGAPAPLYLVGHEFAWVLVVSAVRGTGFAILTVLLPLTASRLVSTDRRGEAIGVYGLSSAIPNLIGVPLGVALTSADGFRWVAIAAASPLFGLPMLGSVGRSLRSPEAPPPVVAGSPRIRTASALRAVATATLVLLMVTLAGGGVLTFLPVARPSGALAAVALLIFGAAGAFSRWRAGVLSDRVGSRLLLPLAVIIAAVGLLVLAAGLALPAAVLVLIGSVLLGLGYGSVQNITLLVAFDRAGPANQATASAAWNAAYDAGTAVGALVVGVVAAAGTGFPAAFVGCAVLIVLTLPLAARATRPAMG